MGKTIKWLTSISFVIAIVLVAPKVFKIAEAATTTTFEVTDNPGNWFDCSGSLAGCMVIGAEKSLALLSPGDTVKFQSHGQTNTRTQPLV